MNISSTSSASLVSGVSLGSQDSSTFLALLMLAGAAVPVIAVMLAFGYLIRDWDSARVAWSAKRAWSRLSPTVTRAALIKMAVIAVLLAVFAFGWWITTDGSARALERAHRDYAASFPLGRVGTPRTSAQMAAATALREAELRSDRDFALGLGVGLAASVTLLAGVVLWQRLKWQPTRASTCKPKKD